MQRSRNSEIGPIFLYLEGRDLNGKQVRENVLDSADGFRLYIPTADAKKFTSLIAPHIIPSMIYKLPYNPVTTESAGIWRMR